MENEELLLEVLDPRDEMNVPNIVTCKWDGNPETQTCWLGERPGEG